MLVAVGRGPKMAMAAPPSSDEAKDFSTLSGMDGFSETLLYEVSPLICPKCQGEMRIIAFIIDFSVVDRIINHLNPCRERQRFRQTY